MDGQELKVRRQKFELTRRQLAQLLKVSEDATYRWETGRLSILPARESTFEIIEAKFNERKSGICPKTAITGKVEAHLFENYSNVKN